MIMIMIIYMKECNNINYKIKNKLKIFIKVNNI